MDVFNHNWTQRIKTEPYINMALNTDYNITCYQLKIGAYPNGYTFLESTSRWSPAEERRVKNLPTTIHYEIDRDGRIEQNTRPQSLYNLRYVRRKL